jgi:acyl carrier protein
MIKLPEEWRDIDPRTPFEELGADSLDHVDLIMAPEEAFSLEIPEAGALRLRCVQECMDYIEAHAKSLK